MKFLMYQHQSSDNHGCEALVYTISEQIKSKFPDSYVEVASFFSDHDKAFSFPFVDKFIQNNMWLKRFTFPWLVHQIDKRTFNSKKIQEAVMYCKPCYEKAKQADVIVAIGGDTYCYNEGREHWPIDRKMHKLSKPMILWGCSLEPDDLKGEMANHLGNFDIITARESITYNALKEANVNSEIVLCADPAFNLPIEECALPDGFEQGKMIGLNFSPMVMGNIKSEDKPKIRSSVDGFIKYILDTTDQKVVLIPHVRLSFSDDITELRPIYERFKDTGRVLLVDDKTLNARQLKFIISKCNIFIGARTHATVAAYSTTVPTLAIGYSVKARGITRDLFGSEENMLIQISDLKNSEKLIEMFEYINSRKAEIKQHLEKIMPEYKNKAYSSSDALQKLIGER